MNVLSVLMLGPDSAFPAGLAEAVGSAFPHAVPTPVPDLAAALAQPPCPGLELFMIGQSGSVPVTEPEDCLDAENLPRWAVLRFGGESGSIPTEGWTAATLAVLLGHAAARHALSRDSARLRGDLLTMARRISHDLRTPLGGIIATIDMVAETIPAAHAATKPVFSSIDEITKIITRTSMLLKAIAQPLPRKPLNMAAPVSEALVRLERSTMEKQAVIHQPDSWPVVAGVAPWLENMWWNLVHNALQHAGPCPVITLRWEETTDGHSFSIHDSGPGMAPQSPNTRFSSFHRLHDPNAPHGYGLAIVRRLTELQGGRCGGIQGTAGGSTFYFTLPDAVRRT